MADVIPSRYYFAAAALLAAVANGAIVLVSGFAAALLLRFATGVFLAGVYPPAMKMVATWFQTGRGLAIGTIVGALTMGKATPYLVRAVEGADMQAVILLASAGATIAGVLVLIAYRDGPYAFERKAFSWALVGAVVREREWRLATGGYLGHMWELYSFWTWIAAFLAASAAARVAIGAEDAFPRVVDALAFASIAIGGLGCLWGGWLADRIGQERLVIRAMAISGACALVTGLFFGSSLWLVVALAWVWGFFVIADSAQFSTLVTRSVPAHAVGTALTLQTSLGFLLTMVTIQLVPAIAAVIGWRWAFVVLAAGPAVGILAIRRLLMERRVRTR